jgi:hypothetical protein
MCCLRLFTQHHSVFYAAALPCSFACLLLHVLQASPAFLGKPVLPIAPRSSPYAPHSRARATPALRATSAARSSVLVEANLFSRLVRVVKAYVSNFTEQFEDPEVMLDRVTDEMQEDLIKMRQATAKVGGACVHV